MKSVLKSLVLAAVTATLSAAKCAAIENLDQVFNNLQARAAVNAAQIGQIPPEFLGPITVIPYGSETLSAIPRNPQSKDVLTVLQEKEKYWSSILEAVKTREMPDPRKWENETKDIGLRVRRLQTVQVILKDIQADIQVLTQDDLRTNMAVLDHVWLRKNKTFHFLSQINI